MSGSNGSKNSPLSGVHVLDLKLDRESEMRRIGEGIFSFNNEAARSS